jgi:hypothetical protein
LPNGSCAQPGTSCPAGNGAAAARSASPAAANGPAVATVATGDVDPP